MVEDEIKIIEHLDCEIKELEEEIKIEKIKNQLLELNIVKKELFLKRLELQQHEWLDKNLIIIKI